MIVVVFLFLNKIRGMWVFCLWCVDFYKGLFYWVNPCQINHIL